MLFVAIDEEVVFNIPIARRFESNSLFDQVILDPPPKRSMALLVWPKNLLLSTSTLAAPKLVSIPVPPSGPLLLLFWMRLWSIFAWKVPVLSISIPTMLFWTMLLRIWKP